MTPKIKLVRRVVEVVVLGSGAVELAFSSKS